MLTRKGKLLLTYNRNFSDRLDATQQLSVAYTLRFEYKFTRNAMLTSNVTHVERETHPTVNDFILNEGRAGFKLTW